MGKIKLQQILGNLLEKLRNLVHEWNGPPEICSLPQAIENSRQFLFSEQIFYRKDAPDM